MSFLPEGHEFYKFILEYSGEDSNLKGGEINILAYTKSLYGYHCFSAEVCDILGFSDFDLRVVAEDEGSFRSTLLFLAASVNLLSASLGILSFFKVEPSDVVSMYKQVKKSIILEIKKVEGNYNKLIELINISELMSDEEKERLIKLIRSDKFRESLDDFTSPLDEVGYETIKVLQGPGSSYEIKESERPLFRYVSPREESIEYFQEVVEIIYLSPELARWKFRGRIVFWAEIEDGQFLERTKNKKSSELSGVQFLATGRKIVTRREGQKKRNIEYIVDSISEIPQKSQLPLT